MNPNATVTTISESEQIIRRLGLEPLQPEGGYFKRTWTGSGMCGTAIYFLLTREMYSALHRLKADEIWHHYSGDTVEHVQLRPGSRPLRKLLGSNLLVTEAEEPQLIVPAHTWQGARLTAQSSHSKGWALLGCTLSPGWQDEDFELGRFAELCAIFPEDEKLISLLTR